MNQDQAETADWIAEIAEALNWRVVPNPENWARNGGAIELRKPSNRENPHIWIERQWNNQKVELSPCWPHSTAGNIRRGTIKPICVSTTRPIPRVVADIRRRLIEPYLEQWAEQYTRATGDIDADRKRLADLRSLADLAGVKLNRWQEDQRQFSFDMEHGRCAVEARHHAVHIEMTCTMAVAEKITATLATRRAS